MIRENSGLAWFGNEVLAKDLVNFMKPKVIVEIGTYTGFSAAAFAEPGIGKVYTIDIIDRNQYLNLMKYDNIEVIIAPSAQVAATWKRKIDILHIDGAHDYENVLKDLKLWAPHLKENGVILMHDVFNPNLLDPLVVFLQLRLGKWTKRALTSHSGLGIITQNKKVLEFLEKNYREDLLTPTMITNLVLYISAFNEKFLPQYILDRYNHILNEGTIHVTINQRLKKEESV